MSDPLTFSVQLDYVDGTQERFEVEVQPDEVPAISKLGQVVEAGVLAVETKDGLVSVPISSIKRLTINPVPPRLPGYVVRHARRVE